MGKGTEGVKKYRMKRDVGMTIFSDKVACQHAGIAMSLSQPTKLDPTRKPDASMKRPNEMKGNSREITNI